MAPMAGDETDQTDDIDEIGQKAIRGPFPLSPAVLQFFLETLLNDFRCSGPDPRVS